MRVNNNVHETKRHRFLSNATVTATTLVGAGASAKYALNNVSQKNIDKFEKAGKILRRTVYSWNSSFDFEKGKDAVKSGEISTKDMAFMRKLYNHISTSSEILLKNLNSKDKIDINESKKSLNLLIKVKEFVSNKKSLETFNKLADKKIIDVENLVKYNNLRGGVIAKYFIKPMSKLLAKHMALGATIGFFAGYGLTKFFDGGHKTHNHKYAR